MRPILRALAILAALAGGPAAYAQAPRFRTDVSLVRVEAAVIDESRLVTGLKQNAFQLLDNGQPREILHFSEDEEPLDLLLLFDVSGSMRASVEKIAAAAGAAFHQLMEGDRVGVMTFADKPRLALAVTGDLEAAARAIRESVLGGRIGGGTRILKAADAAAGQFRGGPRDRRRAVLIITDNEGAGLKREGTVVRDYWEADASLSGIFVRPSALAQALRWYSRVGAPYMIPLEERANGVIARTGGDIVKSNDPAAAFAEMIGRLRRRYCLYYRLPEAKPGEERRIQVRLAPEVGARLPKARVLARAGYIVPQPGQPGPVR